jgi:transcriptional regulator with PAS, ATPase and Fis domain
MEKNGAFFNIIGYYDVKNEARRIAKRDSSIIILGETGAGKTLLAYAIHKSSERKDKNFITIDCPSLSPSLFEAEIFGHRKGSFTDAKENRIGIIEEADGGTAFFDEMGDLPFELQSKILQIVEQKCFRRIGENDLRRVDVRFIFATNRDLNNLVKEGKFRKDLFFRIAKDIIYIPPLRERKEDFELIAQAYWRALGGKEKLTNEEMEILFEYSYPGNIRELKTILDSLYFKLKEDIYIDGAKIFKVEIEILKELADDGIESKTVRKESSIQSRHSYRIYMDMVNGGKSFWEVVHKPYLQRRLNWYQLRELIHLGLETSGGSFKRLLNIFNIDKNKYKKFLDFLRHQGIKVDKKRALSQSDGIALNPSISHFHFRKP